MEMLKIRDIRTHGCDRCAVARSYYFLIPGENYTVTPRLEGEVKQKEAEPRNGVSVAYKSSLLERLGKAHY